jgi:CDP-glucose 4,6-dehydratase
MVMSDFWKQRRVLVTGCTGLLGSWMTEELIARGAQVIGLVRDQIPQSRLWQTKSIDQLVTVRGEIENLATLERILSEYEIDTVFHLAAQTIVGVLKAPGIF